MPPRIGGGAISMQEDQRLPLSSIFIVDRHSPVRKTGCFWLNSHGVASAVKRIESATEQEHDRHYWTHTGKIFHRVIHPGDQGRHADGIATVIAKRRPIGKEKAEFWIRHEKRFVRKIWEGRRQV